MATKFVFDGKRITLPGIYSRVISDIKNPPKESTYGNVLIIDTGKGAEFGGGAGIDGTLEKGENAIQTWDNIAGFRNSVRGGLWWLLAKPLFIPDKDVSIPGVSKIHFIKAATTTPAKISYEFDGGSTIEISVRNEGIVGNGALNDNDELSRGAASKLRVSLLDGDKFVLDFYLGTWKGSDGDDDYDFIAENDCKPVLVSSSPQFVEIQTLIDWMNQDSTFNQYFKLTDFTVSGDVNSSDVTDFADYQLAEDGTEEYSTENLDLVLDQIATLDYSFIILNDSGEDAQSTDNSKVLYHIVNESKFKRFMCVGAGDDKDAFEGSLETAAFYNLSKCIVVHGAPYKKRPKVGLKQYDIMYKLAEAVGRTAGLPPQVPVTFKSIDIDGEVHPLSDKEKERALNGGLLVTCKDEGQFKILEGVNSLQDNDFILNPDGQSHLISFERIAAQVDKTIIINGKNDLLGQENGPNRNTLSEEVVAEWLKGQLKAMTVGEEGEDNLLISSKNIQVTRTNGAYFTNYEIAPNTEINKLFFTARVTEI